MQVSHHIYFKKDHFLFSIREFDRSILLPTFVIQTVAFRFAIKLFRYCLIIKFGLCVYFAVELISLLLPYNFITLAQGLPMKLFCGGID